MTGSSEQQNVLGNGNWQYRAIRNWPQLPSALELVEAIGVTVMPDDRVVVFNRGTPAILVFESNGTFVTAWHDEQFVRPHGISTAPDGTLYLTDDLGHRVAQYHIDGQCIRQIGPAGIPSPTGVDGFDYRHLVSAGPYHLPTNVAITDSGELFVVDGYGNARVHHFDADGEQVTSWGQSGDAPGAFHVPHGVCVSADERVLVADRENSRIQIFDFQGKLLDIWTDVIRPCQIFAGDNDVFFVAELGNQNGRFPWQPLPDQPTGGRVSIFDPSGKLLSRWGGGLDARQPDGFYACHDICVDSEGSIYVGEVAVTAARAAGDDPSGLPTLRKFVRLEDNDANT